MRAGASASPSEPTCARQPLARQHLAQAFVLERRFRVADSERFRQVRQEGASHAHPLMILSYLRNDAESSRCGFTVSKRIGKAVERNRARRRMREAVRALWDLIEPGWDLIWIARPGINEASFQELQDACARLLRRARLLKE